jgi:biotin-(acetyl-CoA carboxylase) ligase
MVAVAASDALVNAVGVEPSLRWPNDLFLAGRKLGGILCESSFTGARLEFAVAGVGINVNQSPDVFGPEIASRAIALREILGRPSDPLELGAELVARLEHWCGILWEDRNAAAILERWQELATGAEDSRIRVVPRGEPSYEAVTRGLAPGGGLRVRLDDGSERILHSDDVHLLDAGEPQRADQDSYYARVESHFVARRGSPLFISPSEWQWVMRWEQLGIPLEIVQAGIDRVFERPRTSLKPRRLSYCRQAVEAAFRRHKEASVGARGPDAEDDRAGVRPHLLALSARLRELGEEWRAKREEWSRALREVAELLDSAARRAEEGSAQALLAIESDLESADLRLLTGAESAVSDEAREGLRREAEASLEPYRHRMPEKVYRAALESSYRKRLRRKVGLPLLSLYAH